MTSQLKVVNSRDAGKQDNAQEADVVLDTVQTGSEKAKTSITASTSNIEKIKNVDARKKRHHNRSKSVDDELREMGVDPHSSFLQGTATV